MQQAHRKKFSLHAVPTAEPAAAGSAVAAGLHK